MSSPQLLEDKDPPNYAYIRGAAGMLLMVTADLPGWLSDRGLYSSLTLGKEVTITFHTLEINLCLSSNTRFFSHYDYSK